MYIDPRIKKRIYLFLQAGGVGGLALLLLFIFALSVITHMLAVPSPTAITKGVVIHNIAQRRRVNDCEISYEVDGKAYVNMTVTCGWADKGDIVDVIYQTTNPNKSAVDQRMFGYIAGFFGLLFGIGSYILFKKFIREEKQNAAPRAAVNG